MRIKNYLIIQINLYLIKLYDYAIHFYIFNSKLINIYKKYIKYIKLSKNKVLFW